MLKPLKECGSSSFEVGGTRTRKWMCFAVVASYCCAIPGGKYMLCVKHGIEVRRPFVRCTTTGNAIHSLCSAELRRFTEMKYARSKFRKNLEDYARKGRGGRGEEQRKLVNRAEDTLRAVSLSPWISFLEMQAFRAGEGRPGTGLQFTCEPLHSFYLGISGMLKERMFSNFSSETVVKRLAGRNVEPKFRGRIKNAFLRGCNVLVRARERDSLTPVEKVEFSE